jgi:AcrR family transcriptional regulator
VAAALELFHQQGVENTSLGQIAETAEVPLGNVYYYFKTKDELLEAVIDHHLEEMRTAMSSLDRLRTPRARLKAFARMLMDQREIAARYGCPQGTLCSELDKRGDELTSNAARLMEASIEWAERQFREIGRRDARDLAVALIAAYQGISLLTNTLRDPDLMLREGRRLQQWIDSVE